MVRQPGIQRRRRKQQDHVIPANGLPALDLCCSHHLDELLLLRLEPTQSLGLHLDLLPRGTRADRRCDRDVFPMEKAKPDEKGCRGGETAQAEGGMDGSEG